MLIVIKVSIQFYQIVIQTVRLSDQFFVGSPLYDFAPIQHDDLVAIAYRTEAMGDHKGGAYPAPEVVHNDFFGIRI